MPRWILIFLISVFFVFNLLVFSKPALAQDAIQCKPPKLPGNIDNPFSGINLNNNLRLINSTDTLNDIYLGNGEIYFGSDFANTTPYATNDSGNLLLRNDSAQIINRSNTIEFQNSSGNSFAQFFTGSTPTLSGAGNLLVNGKIEGLGDVQGSKVCVTGGGTQCVSSWSGVNIAGYGESRCDGVNSGALGACANVVATNNVTATGGNVVAGYSITAGGTTATAPGQIVGKQLCVPDSGGSNCIDSWADVLQPVGGTTVVNNQMTFDNSSLNITNNSTLNIDSTSTINNFGAYNSYGYFKACSDPNNTPTDYTDDVCVGSGRGVSKIINTDGTISISPASGDGDVTISSVLAPSIPVCDWTGWTDLTPWSGGENCQGNLLVQDVIYGASKDLWLETGSCSTSHAKGYTCTLSITAKGSYSLSCSTANENHDEWYGTLTDQRAALDIQEDCDSSYDCDVKVDYLVGTGQWILSSTGKENNFNNPRTSTKSCSAGGYK